MKKNLFAFLLSWGAALHAAPLKVIAATADLASLAREVGGADAAVECLASPLQDPHFVEPKPSLVLKLMKADAVVLTGLDLEVGWAPVLLQQSRNSKVQPGAPGYIDASAAIAPLEVPAAPDRSQGDVHPGGNPHYMGDPANAGKVAALLAERFGALRPEARDAFRGRAAAFQEKLAARSKAWEAALAPYRGAPFVSYHRDVHYFAVRFGLSSVGEIEPKPGIPPSPVHTADLTAAMQAKKVRLILTAPWHEGRTPEALARRTGARVAVFSPYPAAGEDYLAAMDRNVRDAVAALKGGM